MNLLTSKHDSSKLHINSLFGYEIDTWFHINVKSGFTTSRKNLVQNPTEPPHDQQVQS